MPPMVNVPWPARRRRRGRLTFPACCCSRPASAWPPTARARGRRSAGCRLAWPRPGSAASRWSAPTWCASAGRHQAASPGTGQPGPAPLRGPGPRPGAGLHRQRGPVRRAVPRPGVPAADPAPRHDGHRSGAAAPGDRHGPGELAGQRADRAGQGAARR